MNAARCLSLLTIAVLVTTSPAQPPSGPRLIAHRGLLKHAPENTLAAFGACLDLKLGFELDVRRTRDGHLVCLHDADVKRTTDGKGKVNDLTLAELRRLDAGRWFDGAFNGQRVPTLDEAFALVKARGDSALLVAIDIKDEDDAIEADIVALATKHGVLKQLVCIGRAIDDSAVRRRLRAADVKTPVAVLAQTAKDLPAALADDHADWAYLRFLPTAGQVKQAHQTGKRVLVVGPLVMGKEPANWQRVRDAGADALLTDYPLECRQAWKEAAAGPTLAQGFRELHTLGHDGWVGGVAFSPDGKSLATASADGTAAVWDVASGEKRVVCKGHGDYVCAVSFSPDGKTLATGSYDKTMKLWDAATGRCLDTFEGHRGVVMAVGFHPQGDRIATGSVDGTIRLWHPGRAEESQTLTGHRAWVNALAFVGADMVSGSSDGSMRYWPSGRPPFGVSTPTAAGEVRSVAASPDRTLLAAGMRYGQVIVWSTAVLKENKTLQAHDADVWCLAFSPDGKTLATGNGDWNRPGSVKLWDTATWQPAGELKNTGEVLCLAYSPDGRYLAAGSWDKTVKLWRR